MHIDSLFQIGWDEHFETRFRQIPGQSCFPARVITQHAGSYIVITETGVFTAKTSGKFRYTVENTGAYPVVGDFVVAQQTQGADFLLIQQVLERKNHFSRKTPISGGRKIKNGMIDGGTTEEQILVANIDTLFLISGLDDNFNLPRLERYLTNINHQQLPVVILLNKVDLCNHPEQYVAEVQKIAPKVPVLPMSAVTHTGLDLLAAYIKPGKTIVCVGSSGVGKSTLINALFGTEIQPTRATSLYSGKGVHTTTSRQTFFHPSGCIFIDTPGIKELQLWAEREDVAEVFHDVMALMGRCRFSNCAHQTEPGCAIKTAIAEGRLEPERYKRFLAQQREINRLEERKKEHRQKTAKRGMAR